MSDGLPPLKPAFLEGGLYCSQMSLGEILALVADVKDRGMTEVRVALGAGFAVTEELRFQGVYGVQVLEQDGPV